MVTESVSVADMGFGVSKVWFLPISQNFVFLCQPQKSFGAMQTKICTDAISQKDVFANLVVVFNFR